MGQVGTQRLWTRPNGHTYQTHCKNGHEFTAETTYISPKSQKRSCRICTTARIKERWATEPDLKVKNRNHMREWRSANRERDRSNWTNLRKKKKIWLDEQKVTGCINCPEKDPACLDFHHRDPQHKKANLSEAIAQWSIERLQNEVNKCDILCANCHRKLHATERKDAA